jgi:transposase
MRPYSHDLRERIVRAYDAGMPKFRIMQTFQVGRATVSRYITLRRKTGGLAPKPIPGRPPRIGPAQLPALVAQLETTPDATLAEHCATWAETRQTRVSPTSMGRAIERTDWTRKKRRK